jgi:hypothetical protein
MSCVLIHLFNYLSLPPSIIEIYLSIDLSIYQYQCQCVYLQLARTVANKSNQWQQWMEQQQSEASSESENEEGQGVDGHQNISGGEDAARVRDRLVDIIAERTQDVNSFVRAAALKAMAELCVYNALPLASWDLAADLGMQRLYDNKSTVRRHAVVLLGTLMENNPFNSQLEPGLYAKRVLTIQTELARLDDQLEEERADKADAMKAQLLAQKAKKERQDGEEEEVGDEEEVGIDGSQRWVIDIAFFCGQQRLC